MGNIVRLGQEVRNVWWSSGRCGGIVGGVVTYKGRFGGLVICVPATRSARPRFESRPGASPQSGLRSEGRQIAL